MTSINPFSGYVAQGSQIERTQAGDKTRQVRREQAITRSVALRDDEMEHQVESSDAVAAVHDDHQPPQQQKQKQKHHKPAEDDKPHIDITG